MRGDRFPPPHRVTAPEQKRPPVIPVTWRRKRLSAAGVQLPMRPMMRVLPAILAPALLFANDPGFVCRIPRAMVSPRQQQEAAYHIASVTAELVAPSTTSTASGTRHRAVLPPTTGPLPTINFIDTDLFASMKSAGVQPTSLSSDDEFLRRISLDLTGQIPDSATVIAFLNDKTTDKRAKKI